MRQPLDRVRDPCLPGLGLVLLVPGLPLPVRAGQRFCVLTGLLPADLCVFVQHVSSSGVRSRAGLVPV
jgi:hypothetical protein